MACNSKLGRTIELSLDASIVYDVLKRFTALQDLCRVLTGTGALLSCVQSVSVCIVQRMCSVAECYVIRLFVSPKRFCC